MEKSLKSDSWIWVIVQDPGPDEQFLGQFDEKKNEAFIPAFYQKEDAQQCLKLMSTKRGKKYEAQAIRYHELARDAQKNGFMIFILKEDGEIAQKFNP